MDFQVFGNSLKIKSKKATLAVDPSSSTPKFDADAVLAASNSADLTRINNYRVVINSVGEYEVSGLKISGIRAGDDCIFVLSSDGAEAIVAKTSSLEKIAADKIGDYQIVVLNVDSSINQSIITAMEPRVIILYGENAKEGARVLGKEDQTPTSKISLSEDKLPEETNIVILG